MYKHTHTTTEKATTIIAIFWNQLVLATTTTATVTVTATATTHDDGEVKWVSHMCDISETALAIRNTKSECRRPKKKQTKNSICSGEILLVNVLFLFYFLPVSRSSFLVFLLFASFALIIFSHFPILYSRSRFVRTNK